MVKGLAKLGNRLRHDRQVKCVDASPSGVQGDYSPMTKRFYRSVQQPTGQRGSGGPLKSGQG